VFELFTDRARRVVVLSQEQARMAGHDSVTTEHVLLGLIHEGDGVAARVLESLGLGLETTRQQVQDAIGRGEHYATGRIPFTPQAREVLTLALEESRALGHRYIGTEHILLGLVAATDSMAARLLAARGTDLTGTRERVIQVLAEHLRTPGPATG
jgi:ATP-dependent Clp protease ATP-binding subunit ClpC